MKRPQATAQMADAVRAGAPELASDEEDDEEETRGFGVQYSHPEKKQRRGSGPNPASPLAGSAGKIAAAAPGSNAGRQGIENYFHPRDGAGMSPPAPPLFSTPGAAALGPESSSRKENFPPGGAAAAGGGSARGARGIAHRAEHELMALEQGLSNAKRQADDATRRATKLESDLAAASAREKELSSELDASREREAARERAAKDAELRRVDGVKALAVKVAQFERERSRREMAETGLRLGSVSVQRAGAALQEVWEDGGAFAALDERARGSRRRRRRRTSSARRSSATCRFRARTPPPTPRRRRSGRRSSCCRRRCTRFAWRTSRGRRTPSVASARRSSARSRRTSAS